MTERLSEFLNLDLYIYETRIVSREKAEANLGAHLDYQVEIEKAGNTVRRRSSLGRRRGQRAAVRWAGHCSRRFI